MAKSDWPDEWPALLDDLITYLQRDSRAEVHGAMQVISDIVREDLSEDQLLPVTSSLLPPLLVVLQNEQVSCPDPS